MGKLHNDFSNFPVAEQSFREDVTDQKNEVAYQCYLCRCDSVAAFNRVRQCGDSAAFSGTGYWPAAGVRAENEVTGRNFRFALETPFVGRMVQCATQIEDDYVIFQPGRDQTCILHSESKKIALIARGKGRSWRSRLRRRTSLSGSPIRKKAPRFVPGRLFVLL